MTSVRLAQASGINRVLALGARRPARTTNPNARAPPLPRDRATRLEGPGSRTRAGDCEEQGSDCLVVGTVRRNPVERLLLGATAEGLLTRAGCDVMVVKPDDFESDWL